MRFVFTFGVVLFSSALFGQAESKQEWTLNLSQYGLVKTGCARYPGHVEFLDDDHLVVSAPVGYTCKNDFRKPLDTIITEIDLQGHKLVAIRRANVAELVTGPIGFIAVCASGHVELLSRDLQPTQSIVLSGDASSGCYFGPGLSPSRTAIAIAGFSDSKMRLYHGGSSDPIEEITLSKGQSVRALTDEGFLVCPENETRCNVVGAKGVVRSFPIPQLYGASGSYIVGLVAPDRLLLAGFDGKSLYAETSTGTTVNMGDVAALKPPYIDGSQAQMSAAEPRRILYHVDGCLLGDFDDCYGVVFRRFAVFDSQSARMLFRHSYRAGADLKISPNGKLVMEQDGPQVRFFRLP